jgi:hypothetical protein
VKTKTSATSFTKLAGLILAGILLMVCCSRDQAKDSREAEALEDRLARLKSVPYTSVTEERVEENSSGVLVYDTGKAFPGYNLFCSTISPEVLLLDMHGRLVQRWGYESEHEDDVCEYAILLANGDVIVVDKFKYVLKLDWKSNILWKTQLVAHHEVSLSPESTIYTISLEGKDHRGFVVRFPVIVELSADGREIDRWSAYDHLEEIKRTFDQRSFMDTILDSLLVRYSWLEVYDKIAARGEAIRLLDARIQYDHFHLNTITVLPDTRLGRTDGRFRAGNLLICFRNVNQIAILDQSTREIQWVWGEGLLEWPHHPTMLEDGNILVFDNGSFRKHSRVLELNPVTREVVWEYSADPPEDFYSYGRGSAQRLPNGNTLICEGDRGRVFEVTEDGQIVWEWLNPMMEEGRRVQVYRMIRYPAELVEPLVRNR